MPLRSRLNAHHPLAPLLLALLAGLVLRLALWDNLPRQGMISDEAEYLAAANWLAQGRGFAWHQGWLWTRAPLYPLFLAAHIYLFGMHLAPIYLSQTLLSLVNVVLVYLLAQQVWPRPSRRVPFVAALLAALYLPLASYPQLLLSETLYLSLLLAAFVLLGRWAALVAHSPPDKRPIPWLLLMLAAGLLGLSTLTRGLTLGFLPFAAGWVWWVSRPFKGRHGDRNRPSEREPLGSQASRLHSSRPDAGAPSSSLITHHSSLIPAAFLLVYVVTLLPWSLYASNTYGGPIIVDTTSAFNVLLGARTAYDGSRSDAPTRNFILALLDERASTDERHALVNDACLYRYEDARLLTALNQPATEITQAQRQQLMSAEGGCLLREKPAAFIHKSLRELVDFFQINYTGAERLSGGFTLGRLPRWYALALFLLDDTLYVLVLPLAIVGWSRATRHLPRAAPLTTLAGLWWLYILLTTPLLFAINRFRLPLLPFAFVYAALLAAPRDGPLRPPRLAHRALHALALLLALVATTPYAYLQAPPADWASYLGPYPSSFTATWIAWNARPTWQHHQRVIDALGAGDTTTARTLVADSTTPTRTTRLALPLLAGLEGRPADGLAMLPNPTAIAARKDWQASVVRGALLRRMGDESGAKAAFTPMYVDDQNPVTWAWEWLHPPPTRRIDLAGNLDLGYIKGFYLGEGDTTAAGNGTFRWSEPRAWLRFPEQGRATPQQLCLRTDGRGWPTDMAMPDVSLTLVLDLEGAGHSAPFATFPLQRDVRVVCETMPPTPPGSDVVIVLRSSTAFVPNAADLLSQQGPQVGQLRLLGVRLDWVELRKMGEGPQ